jgi:hypothetical protein
MRHTSSSWIFTRGVPRGSEKAYFLSFFDAGDDQPLDATQIIIWSSTKVQHSMIKGWQAVGIIFIENPEPTVVAVGAYGDAWVGTSKGFSTHRFDSQLRGPLHFGPIRDLRVIGGEVFAVGMSRQVYHMKPTGIWTHIDENILVPAGKGKAKGFTSIHGFSAKDLFAVGFEGEIWQRIDANWAPIPSPTNMKLERVVCTPDRTIYAVGQAGTIIRGFNGTWTILEQSLTTKQFWGAEWFRNRLWLSTDDNLYFLNSYGHLEMLKVDFIQPGFTCGYLSSNEEVLWSIGSRDLFWTKDGEDWNQISFPDTSK